MRELILSYFRWEDQGVGRSFLVSLGMALLAFVLLAFDSVKPLASVIVCIQFVHSLPGLRLFMSRTSHEIDGPETLEEVVEEWIDSIGKKQ